MMNPTCRELLFLPDLAPQDRARLISALSSPWGFPHRKDLAAIAVQQFPEIIPSPIPAPGSSLLVSHTPGASSRTALWELVASPPKMQPLQYSFLDRAVATLERSEQLVLKDLPIFPLHRAPGVLHPASVAKRWSARHIVSNPVGVDAVLDGASFGLAMCIGVASMHMGLPAPVELCALACVQPDGCLGKVGELENKLKIVAGWALGVVRVIVAEPQRDDACEIAKTISADFEIVPADCLSSALKLVFPNMVDEVVSHWKKQGVVKKAADNLFFTALKGSNIMLGWNGIAEAARRLEGILREVEGSTDQPAVYRSWFAGQVARRHEGNVAPIEWPDSAWLAALGRPLRLRVMAHAVQSATDGSEGREREYAESALAYLAAAGEEHAEDLILRGAIGRAFAAVRDYTLASQHLLKTLEGWKALDELMESTLALSEYFRVRGILGDESGVRRAMEEWGEPLSMLPGCPAISMAFVHLAAGRALVQIGQPEEGMAQLGDASSGVDWEAVPAHLKWSRRRWLARAQDGLGRGGEADQHRASLRQSMASTGNDHAREDFYQLAMIDQALRDGHDEKKLNFLIRSMLEGRYGYRIVRLIDQTTDAHEQATRLAEEYQY